MNILRFRFSGTQFLNDSSIAELKMGFDAFDPDKRGVINTDMVGTILGMMGMKIPTEQLNGVIAEADPFGALNSFAKHW